MGGPNQAGHLDERGRFTDRRAHTLAAGVQLRTAFARAAEAVGAVEPVLLPDGAPPADCPPGEGPHGLVTPIVGPRAAAARWRDCARPGGLHPLPADAPTFCRMPPVHIAWVPTNAQEPYDVNRSALLPLYLDPEREVQLGELRLPCSGTEASWLQAGAALFLSGGEA